MTISQAISKCNKSGIKVYGLQVASYFFVEMSDRNVNNGEPKRYKKSLNSNKDLNEAVTKTYIHFANQIS